MSDLLPMKDYAGVERGYGHQRVTGPATNPSPRGVGESDSSNNAIDGKHRHLRCEDYFAADLGVDIDAWAKPRGWSTYSCGGGRLANRRRALVASDGRQELSAMPSDSSAIRATRQTGERKRPPCRAKSLAPIGRWVTIRSPL
jgi:hypothetical protein